MSGLNHPKKLVLFVRLSVHVSAKCIAFRQQTKRHTHTHTYTHTYIYIYIYIYIHTPTCIHVSAVYMHFAHLRTGVTQISTGASCLGVARLPFRTFRLFDARRMSCACKLTLARLCIPGVLQQAKNTNPGCKSSFVTCFFLQLVGESLDTFGCCPWFSMHNL